MIDCIAVATGGHRQEAACTTWNDEKAGSSPVIKSIVISVVVIKVLALEGLMATDFTTDALSPMPKHPEVYEQSAQ